MSSSRGKERGCSHFGRRELLKLGAASAITAGLTALPFFRRDAHAMLRTGAPAKRVLVLYFGGGIRSSTAFHASPTTVRYNPWGAIDTGGTPFVLGKLLDDFLPAGTPISTPEAALPDAAYQLSTTGDWAGAQVSRLREIASNFSVVGTWNSERGDHVRSSVEESTGDMTGTEPGLLTRVGAGMAANVDPTMMSTLQIPSFHIEPGAAFGNATDALVRDIPVPLYGVGSLPGRTGLSATETAYIGHDWSLDDAMRARLDQRRFNASVGVGHSVIETYVGDRVARRQIGQQLAQPWFDVSQNPTAAQGMVQTGPGMMKPLTNAMLEEVFVRALGPDPNGNGTAPFMNPQSSDLYRNALDVALAVRLLQLGSPAIAVEMGGFDTHSGERADAPHRFRFVGRLWATLNWLLSRIPEPGETGVSMLDRTLIFTMSEFGRDPGGTSGFNNGEGSDHGNDPSCYYLASAVMGGGIVPRQLVGPASPNNYVPAAADQIPPRRLLSSALWALGLDSTDPDWGFADAPPLTQLWGM